MHLILGLFQSWFETGQSKLKTMLITEDMLFFFKYNAFLFLMHLIIFYIVHGVSGYLYNSIGDLVRL